MISVLDFTMRQDSPIFISICHSVLKSGKCPRGDRQSNAPEPSHNIPNLATVVEVDRLQEPVLRCQSSRHGMALSYASASPFS